MNIQKGGRGGSGWVWQIDRMTLQENVQNLKEKIRKYEAKHCFAISRNNSKHFFSYFRMYFSFAKRSKLGETGTCFVQFHISRNLKKYETVNPTCGPFLSPRGTVPNITFPQQYYVLHRWKTENPFKNNNNNKLILTHRGSLFLC